MRNFLNPNPPPVRETVVKSITTLKVQRNKIDQAAYRLKERDKFLFQTCIGALKSKNKEKAAICANEVMEVRRIVTFLSNVELAIERVILRLETIKELSDIIFDLKPSLRLLQRVSQELFDTLPDVSAELGRVNEAITETLHSTKITTDESIIPVNKKTPGGEEVLKEVSSFLEQKVSEELPEPPAVTEPDNEPVAMKEMIALATTCSEFSGQEDESEHMEDNSQTLFSYKKSEIQEISLKVEKPSLEDALFEYVKKGNREIDLARCSIDLESSYEQIRKALDDLGAKGRIKIEVGAGG